MKDFILYIILFAVPIVGCSNKKLNKYEYEITKEQRSTIINNEQIVDNANFELFLSLFDQPLEKYQYRHNKDKRCINLIPLSLLSEMTHEEYDTVYHISRAYALNYYHQTEEYVFLMYKMECMAGGYCSRFYLATFKKSGEIIENMQVGVDMGTYEEQTLFDYKVVSENHLEVYIKERKYNEDGSTKKEKVETKQIVISEQGEISIE